MNRTANKPERPGANKYYLAPVEDAQVRVRMVIPDGKRLRSVAGRVEAPHSKEQKGSMLEVVIPRVEASQAFRIEVE